MGRLLWWFKRNWADTRGPSHPDLQPLVLDAPPHTVSELLQNVIALLPRWRLERIDANGKRLEATRRTRLFRYIDDITAEIEPAPNNESLVHARSRSRVGTGDLGQNRRNIRELFNAVRKFNKNKWA